MIEEFYKERVGRYRIVKQDTFKGMPERKQEYINAGIDVDNTWQLVWSFDELQPAVDKLAEEILRWNGAYIFRIVDNMVPTEIERPIY